MEVEGHQASSPVSSRADWSLPKSTSRSSTPSRSASTVAWRASITAIDAVSEMALELSYWPISSVCVATRVCSRVWALVEEVGARTGEERLELGDEFLVGDACRQAGVAGDRLGVRLVVLGHHADGHGQIVGRVRRAQPDTTRSPPVRDRSPARAAPMSASVGTSGTLVRSCGRHQRVPIDDERSGETGQAGGANTGDEPPPRQRCVGGGLSDFEIHGGWVLSGHATAAFQPGRHRSDSRARTAVNTGFVRS